MVKNYLKILLLSAFAMMLPLVASADDAQELMVSDIEFIDVGYNAELPMIILTKEGSALNVHLMNYSAHPYTEEFVITPKMSGGSDGEPCSVSIGVSYINNSLAAIITTFNVSFNVHGIEADSFYFSCWKYKGMVSLTEGEPLELWENKNISKDGVIYVLDNKTKTATLSIGRFVEGEYNIPSELDYGGQTFTLTSIEYPAFAWNTSLTSVIIPQSVTNVGNAVFYLCSNLTDVYCYAENVPETGIDVFKDCPIASATLHVPAGSVDLYKETEPWSSFGSIVVLPIKVDEATFPDESFRNWVLAQSYGQDGVLTDEEIAVFHLTLAKDGPGLTAIDSLAIDSHPVAHLFEHRDAGVLDAAVGPHGDIEGGIAVATDGLDDEAYHGAGIVGEAGGIEPVANGCLANPGLRGVDGVGEVELGGIHGAVSGPAKLDDESIQQLNVLHDQWMEQEKQMLADHIIQQESLWHKQSHRLTDIVRNNEGVWLSQHLFYIVGSLSLLSIITIVLEIAFYVYFNWIT